MTKDTKQPASTDFVHPVNDAADGGAKAAKEAPNEAQAGKGNRPSRDFSKFRLSQDFPSMAGVEQVNVSVPVRRPKKSEFVRTRKEPEFKLMTSVLEWGDARDVYLVEPELCGTVRELATVVIPTVLRLAVSLDGVEFVWPLRYPDPARPNRWHVAGFEAASIAEQRWIRVVANMSLGAYEVYAAKDSLGEPRWSGRSFDEFLDAAFKDHIVSDITHPIVRALRGEVL